MERWILEGNLVCIRKSGNVVWLTVRCSNGGDVQAATRASCWFVHDTVKDIDVLVPMSLDLCVGGQGQSSCHERDDGQAI